MRPATANKVFIHGYGIPRRFFDDQDTHIAEKSDGILCQTEIYAALFWIGQIEHYRRTGAKGQAQCARFHIERAASVAAQIKVMSLLYFFAYYVKRAFTHDVVAAEQPAIFAGRELNRLR